MEGILCARTAQEDVNACSYHRPRTLYLIVSIDGIISILSVWLLLVKFHTFRLLCLTAYC
uniref:Uncharacterized protein n=1 Tax=Hyaloperonospora arabidopsidis (strain Emoy2) TaxID=559515 RepID=M4BX04_HYAAE